MAPPQQPEQNAEREGPERPPTRLDADEVRDVLRAHGVTGLRAARALHGGNPRSPKAWAETDAGTLLIKRHPPEASDASRVEQSRRAARAADRAGVPIARALRPIEDAGGTDRAFVRGGAVYEVFAFVEGQRYSGTRAEAADAARVLATLHAGLDEMGGEPPGRAADTPRADLGLLVRVLHDQGLAEDTAVAASLERLESDRSRADAALRGGAAGEPDRGEGPPRPQGPLHGDYHPGNLIYRGGRVAAVLDFGSIRVGPRAAELAAACLHLALIRRGPDPAGWPVAPDAGLLAAAWGAYTGAAWGGIGAAPPWAGPHRAPWRMIESIIEETVMRVAAGAPVGSVRYAARVTAWLCEHADGIGAVLSEATETAPEHPSGAGPETGSPSVEGD